MTNSRLTDPEILEAKFPVLVREFAIRRASGGIETLEATARFDVAPGDELTILTPGGGGFGPPK